VFQSLSDRLTSTFNKLTGRGKLSEENIQKALRDVRVSLLEADVALSVVKVFIAGVRRRALGTEVSKSLSPGEMFIKIVKEELINIMGQKNEGLDLRAEPPCVILMAGLQGSGKTTTTAKLAKFLKDNQKKKVLVASADIYRPAAIEQLKILAGEVGVEFFPSDSTQKPLDIAKTALDFAKKNIMDVLIIDTAGRLHIDQDMMSEIKSLHSFLNPIETLFVVDAMTGQDAAITAKAFNDALSLTGVILSKADGDARGGAALSIRLVTEKPIKFLGMGEKVDALEAFYPDRIASRILGMGDVLSLIEQAEKNLDKEKVTQMAKKMGKGQSFDLQDFSDQLEQMSKLGNIDGILGKLPGMSQVPEAVKNKINDKSFLQMRAMISSMTKKERANPDLINGSRRRRIAAGSGTDIQGVNKLLKQFDQMQKMMKKMGKGGKMMQMMRQLGAGGAGGMPGMGGSGMPNMPGMGGMMGGMGGGMPPGLSGFFKK